MSKKINNLIVKIKICIKLLEGKEMKNVCNDLNLYGLVKTKPYQGLNCDSSYHIFYSLWNNFCEYGIKGLINMQGKISKGNVNKKREEKSN